MYISGNGKERRWFCYRPAAQADLALLVAFSGCPNQQGAARRGGGVAGSRNYRVLCYYTEALYELLAAATTAKAKTQLIALEEDGVECMSCTETAKLIHFSSFKLFVKFFVGILVQTMTPKGHFEIN